MLPREVGTGHTHSNSSIDRDLFFGYTYMIIIIQIVMGGYSYVILESISFSTKFFAYKVKIFSATLNSTLELTGASHGDILSPWVVI